MGPNLTQGHGALRLIAACSLLIMALDVYAISGTTSWWWAGPVCGIIAVFLTITGLSGYCPVYAAMGIRSRPATPAA